MPALPPWLAIDPIAPVGKYLQGYQIGASQGQAAAANARAQQAALIQQQQNAEAMAFRQQQAAQEAQLQQAQQARFQEELRLKQQEAEREAQEAAIQMEGMKEYEKFKASGIPDAQALMQAAPKLFWRHPERLSTAIKQMSEEQRLQKALTKPETIDIEGSKYFRQPSGQLTLVPRPMQTELQSVPIKDENGTVIARAMPTGKGSYVRIPEPKSDWSEPQKIQYRARVNAMTQQLTDMLIDEEEYKKRLKALDEEFGAKTTTQAAPKGEDNEAKAQMLLQQANQRIGELSAGVGVRRLKDKGVLSPEEAQKRITEIQQILQAELAKLGFKLKVPNAPATTGTPFRSSVAEGGLPYLWNPQTGEPNP